MYLFMRRLATNGQMDGIAPILMELSQLSKAIGVDLSIWAGGNGYKLGTLAFTVPYAKIADRAEATAKMGANKDFQKIINKMLPFIEELEEDTIIQFVKGGSVGSSVPVGAVVTTLEPRLAHGADFVQALDKSLKLAELSDKLSGVTHNVGYAVYGELGRFVMSAGYPNAAAAEAARDAMLADPQYIPTFIDRSELFQPGVMQRQFSKIA
ncbi:MAG: hypothetical protein O3B19_10075 [Actinomycetota bacterium]|nr:hypothetical protein [Actinomycetota bacterium]